MNHFQQYENARHVLSEVRDYHHRLAGVYETLAGRASNERARMLLNHLRDREQALAANLHQYEQDAPDNILDTWMQIQYPENLNDFLGLIDTSADLGVEQVRQLAMEADEFLMSLLKHVEDSSLHPDIKAVFANLQALETEEEKAVSQAVESIRDM